MGMIKVSGNLKEGEFINKLMRGRIEKNKNFIVVTTGQTGSGKSYVNLRQAELWYKFNFKQEFPAKHICFSITEVMKLVTSTELKKGDIIILEEAGANAGSADWQSKTVKMFNYLLQTFRSMNVILFMNLPVFTMLAKQARELVHMHQVTEGIDFQENVCKIKKLMHQLNQTSGKSYWKMPRVKRGSRYMKLKEFHYSLPSDKLINAYESKKIKFLSDMNNGFLAELEKIEADKMKKMARDDLTDRQREIFNYVNEGLSPKEVAEMQGISFQAVYLVLQAIKKKGYAVNKPPVKRSQVEMAAK